MNAEFECWSIVLDNECWVWVLEHWSGQRMLNLSAGALFWTMNAEFECWSIVLGKECGIWVLEFCSGQWMLNLSAGTLFWTMSMLHLSAGALFWTMNTEFECWDIVIDNKSYIWVLYHCSGQWWLNLSAGALFWTIRATFECCITVLDNKSYIWVLDHCSGQWWPNLSAGPLFWTMSDGVQIVSIVLWLFWGRGACCEHFSHCSMLFRTINVELESWSIVPDNECWSWDLVHFCIPSRRSTSRAGALNLNLTLSYGYANCFN